MSVAADPGAINGTPLRVASVPGEHVYVRHIGAIDGADGVVRLTDPPPDGPAARPQQWWPPAMLAPHWVREHHDEFDLMHVQFGFDAHDPRHLGAVLDELQHFGKPFVYTIHDLRNPHHAEPSVHDRHLNVLVPRADALVTLTPGAARVVHRRWGRNPLVLPHPHVVEFARMRPRRRGGADWAVGVHAKSLRASMNPLVVVAALVDILASLPGTRLRVDIHHDVYDAHGDRHDDALARLLSEAARAGALELRVHDCFSDDELWDYLESLDLSVLPYRFGTHSGWLEACYDLGTPVLAPSCGFFSQQRPCLTYRHDESGLDVESLRAAVVAAYERRPAWQADVNERAQERNDLAAAHRALYARLLR